MTKSPPITVGECTYACVALKDKRGMNQRATCNKGLFWDPYGAKIQKLFFTNLFLLVYYVTQSSGLFKYKMEKYIGFHWAALPND